MQFLERDLEDIIFNADKCKLHERGLYAHGIMKRQLNIGNYGIADLVTFEITFDDVAFNFHKEIIDTQLRVTVFELKKDKIDVDTFFQAIRYVQGIKRYIHKRKPNIEVVFCITLVGRTLDLSSSLSYLPDLICSENNEYGIIKDVTIFTYSYDAIEGVVFKEHSGYKLKDEGF